MSLAEAAAHGPASFRAYVGLGANLGDKCASLSQALNALDAQPGVRVEAVSSAYASAPVDADGPDYLNAVAALQSTLGPLEVRHILQRLGLAAGRERPYLNAPRSLDLDLLWFGGSQRQSEQLALPHPRWAQRAFVVEPLAELMGQLHAADLPLPHADQRTHLLAVQTIARSSLALDFKPNFK